ncbi:MAG: hypothetical protein ABJV68_05220, partial [Paracoccaceae bacterium]
MTSPHPLPPVAIEAEIKRAWLSEQGRAHGKAADMAMRLRNASWSGQRMWPVWRNYLRNPHVRLSGSLRALGGNPSREEAITLRDRLNPMAGERYIIAWHALKKESGGERYICTLPPELKAIHYMLKRPLEKLFERQDNMFGVRDFSRDDLAGEIKSLQNRGFTSIAITDVVNCYQAVNADAVHQILPLPKEVMRNILDLRNHTLVRDHRTDYQNRSCDIVPPYDTTHKARGPSLEARGPKGLMQGSPISGIILAWLLNGIPTTDDVRVFLCFDNLIVMARTPAETRAMLKTLAVHFEQCSAGPLALCEAEYADGEAIEFLGYLFDPDRRDIGIAAKGLSKLEERLLAAEASQEAVLDKIVADHFAASDSPLQTLHDPLSNAFPTLVWDVLLSFRAGFPMVRPDAPELLTYLDNSRWLAERSGQGMAAFLHDYLFA